MATALVEWVEVPTCGYVPACGGGGVAIVTDVPNTVRGQSGAGVVYGDGVVAVNDRTSDG